ncbi:MAG: 2OG-Fe(II) oxygenase family protein [Woeseia sp.]
MPTTVELQQHEPTCTLADSSVPVIDARKLMHAGTPDPVIPAALEKAARDSGYLYLEHVFGDGTEDRELDRQMRAFFALAESDERKQAICVTGKPVKYGWMPLFGEPAYQPGTIAHVESFDCGRPRRPGDDPSRFSVWPDLPGFRDAVRASWFRLTAVGTALLEAIAMRAGIHRGFLAERCSSQDLSTMRLLHYPARPSPLSSRDVGIAAHTDFECITLLYQTAPGLELKDVSGRWRDAPANPGQVVVLFGDMLERFSNGYYPATGHRVRTSTTDRYSVVLFFAVNDGVVVEPHPVFCGLQNPPRYDSLTQQEHSAREIARSERYRDEAGEAARS